MVERADENMVSWQHWHYCGCDDPTTQGPGDTQAIVLDPKKKPKKDNLEDDKLDVLSRPYPQLTSGTPVSYGFDSDDHEFHFEYDTRRASGNGRFDKGSVTLAFIPRRQYPHGYDVEANGARVLSRPGARVLELASCDGRGENVEVDVTRGDGKFEDGC
jgi:endoglycosylceramidase